ncbi:hypothetical protein Tco_1509939 [Tanacetum coccineum]
MAKDRLGFVELEMVEMVVTVNLVRICDGLFVNKVQVMDTLDGRLLNNTLGTSYSAVAHFGGVTDWYQSQGYREPGIPLVNAGELPEIDPYEEVAQQGQAYPLSPAYVPDPMELDEHVLVYVLEPEHPEYHVSTDDDIQVEDQPYADDASSTAESPGHIAVSDSMEEDSIDYPDELKVARRMRCGSKGTHTDTLLIGEPIEDEEEEEHLALADPSTVPVVDLVPSDGDTKGLSHMEAMIRMRDDIPEDDMPPRRRFVLAAPPPGCDVAKSSAAAARPPRGQYDFVDTVVAGQDFELRMMTSIEEVNLRVSYQAQINVVRGQRIAYEAELRKVRQAYLSSEAQNRALLARLETLETDMTHMEWQRQRAEDD